MSFGASERILGAVRIDGEYADNMRTIRENMATLQDKLLGQAAQVVGYGSNPANSGVANVWTSVPSCEFAITTSGGLLVLVGIVAGSNQERTTDTRILLDGESKAVGIFGFAGVGSGIGYGTATMFWAGNIPAGKHTIALQVSSQSVISAAIYGGSNQTALWALEFIS